MTPQQPDAFEQRREDDRGSCPISRRSFLGGVVGGAAAAAAANFVSAGQARAQGTGNQDEYNKLATEDGTHSIPFFGQCQSGIATPTQSPQATVAS